jgi:hypothetical protein
MAKVITQPKHPHVQITHACGALVEFETSDIRQDNLPHVFDGVMGGDYVICPHCYARIHLSAAAVYRERLRSLYKIEMGK